MQKIIVGERYKDKYHGMECTIRNCYKKGRGYQVCYQLDEVTYVLVSGRGDFLKCFEKLVTHP